MRRSAYRRTAAPSSGNRRLLAVGAVIAALGAVVAFTTISNAAENDRPEGSGAGKVVNGQTILTDTCVDSDLEGHDGFQRGDRCVSTEFGEVASQENNATLLITQAPRQVNVNTPFTLRVSTRNLIRDRFLAAGQGGYYVESAVLRDGITRGHFHTACRMLSSTRAAPDPAPVPAFFVATEDLRGGREPDQVTIQVPGLPTAGIAQCASWAGDGSHRTPMMQRANQTPAIDAVRIVVRQGNNNGGGGNNGGGNNGGGNNNGGNNGGGNATTAPTTAPATTAPATTPATTAPSTRDDFTPKPSTTAKPANTVKPSSTKSAQPSTTRTTESESDTEATESDADESAEEAEDSTPAQTRAAKPKASSKAAEGTDYTYSNDDGQFNSGETATTIDQVASEKSGGDEQGGLLALTGGNSMAVIGAAVVLMLIGLAVMALTRRRRPGTPWE